MANATPAARDQFQAELSVALQHTTAARTVKRVKSQAKIFGVWTTFCQELGQTPDLRSVPTQEQKLSYLLVFGLRYRHGGQKNNPVKHDTVRTALQAVGQGISNLGQPDPRKGANSDKLHPILAAFLDALKAEDDPASRAYPVNISILREMLNVLDFDSPEYGIAEFHCANLIIVAFYFLLRPAEYLQSNTPEARTQAFRFCDIVLSINGRTYNALDDDLPLNDVHDLKRIELVSLTFTDQKNGVKGEQVSQIPSTDPVICPCIALGHIILHLRKYNADPETPIHRHYNPLRHQWHEIKPSHVTTAIRLGALRCKQLTGIDPALLSARSLRPGGATALLCANIDKDAIMLLGRWKSDAMFRYLRIQALAKSFAPKMLAAGAFTFHPQAFRTFQPPNEAPPAVAALLQHDELHDSDASSNA